MRTQILSAAALACATLTGAAGASVIDTTSGLVYHLDPAIGVTSSGGAVSSWADANANGITFNQATAVKQPLLISSAPAFNNKPVVRFDGDLTGNSGGVAPNADEVVTTTSTTMQTVIIVNSTFQHRNLDGIWGDDSADTGIRRTSATAWQHPGNTNDFSNGGSFFVNGVATTNAALNTAHILVSTRGATTTFNDTSIGDYFLVGTNTPRSWNGDVAEVAVYNRALSANEQAQIESFLGSKYGIGVPEPTSAGLLGVAALGLLARRRRVA